jgi:type IV secretory pathway TrbD component
MLCGGGETIGDDVRHPSDLSKGRVVRGLGVQDQLRRVTARALLTCEARESVMTDAQAAAHVLLLMFYWVPFALTAYVVEHWSTERAQSWRQQLVHPIRYRREHRPAHGAPAH